MSDYQGKKEAGDDEDERTMYQYVLEREQGLALSGLGLAISSIMLRMGKLSKRVTWQR
jgi:hypothetical protein